MPLSAYLGPVDHQLSQTALKSLLDDNGTIIIQGNAINREPLTQSRHCIAVYITITDRSAVILHLRQPTSTQPRDHRVIDTVEFQENTIGPPAGL
jgi:hypothetical protein